MILTVCVNPCIDKTITVNGIIMGQYNRIVDSMLNPSGKGVNVAATLSRLGGQAFLTGFNYQSNGGILTELLDKESVPYEFVYSAGEIRTNIKAIDIQSGIMTEFNESGRFAGEDKKDQLEALVERWAAQCDVAVFSGSLPPGCEPSYYARLMNKCPKAKCVLDASGEAFEAGLEFKPYLVKPNSYELSLHAKRELLTPREHLDAALELTRGGINIVCVSMGKNGALITDGLKAYYAPPVQVRVKSTVGAGDAMVAGCVKGISDGLDMKNFFIQGVAAATACVLTEGTTPMLKEDFEHMLPRVEIEEMEI